MAANGDDTRTVKRRGILAAAGAVVAGIVAKQASLPAAAATGGTQGTALIIGANYANGTANVGTQSTMLFNGLTTVGSFYIDDAFVAASRYGSGVQGYAYDQGAGVAGYNSSTLNTAYGVYGSAFNGIGVYGGSAGSSPAVFGQNWSGDLAIGVRGDTRTTGIGVYGTNTNGYAVNGVCTGSGYGVYGVSQSLIGVYGSSAQGTGVFGQTTASNQYGVLGTTYAPNSTAIAGTCSQNGSSAFSGGTSNPNAFAAFFQGTTVVQGNFAVTGTKSAALAHPDGSHRLVYCIESPESWIEDVGKGQLVNGKATITFDKEFAAVTHTDEYRVFLTAHGDSKGLYVTNETASGFEVHEQQGGTSSLTFSWRVMVKRADVKGERLGKFVMPNLPLPDPVKFPKAQASPPTSTPPVPPPPRSDRAAAVPPSAPALASSPPSGGQPTANPPTTGSASNPIPVPRT